MSVLKRAAAATVPFTSFAAAAFASRSLSHWTSSSRRARSRGLSRKRPDEKEGGGLAQRPQDFRVAIIGRPNVGKSRLSNRLAPRDKAIVSPIAGTTRDRREVKTEIGGMSLFLVDTGGLEAEVEANVGKSGPTDIPAYMLYQAAAAVANSHIVLFLIDGRVGVTEEDRRYASWIRRKGGAPSQVCVVVNKVEAAVENSDGVQQCLRDAERLGFGEPVAISAEHGEGMGDLFARIVPAYEEHEEKVNKNHGDEGGEACIRMAIIGRPNVGKSSLLNAVLDEDRSLTGPTPGLTRDTVAVEWSWKGRRVKLVDTAGIRRAAKGSNSLPPSARAQPLEEAAVRDALKALSMAQVVVLVLDGSEGQLRSTELALASRVADEGRALVVAANKSDIAGASPRAYEGGVRDQCKQLLPDLGDTPVVAVCALTGFGVDRLMGEVVRAHDRWRARVSTGLLNAWVRRIERVHAPPRCPKSDRPIRLKYLSQVARSPPTLCLFTNSFAVPEDYKRYLIKALRMEFGFHGMPVRLMLRRAKNPYERGKKKSMG
jgi:GTP-binding protein